MVSQESWNAIHADNQQTPLNHRAVKLTTVSLSILLEDQTTQRSLRFGEPYVGDIDMLSFMRYGSTIGGDDQQIIFEEIGSIEDTHYTLSVTSTEYFNGLLTFVA